MKLDIINDIAKTSSEFMARVIGKDDILNYDTLFERMREWCAHFTEHNDDTIDIDFGNMCFTVHMDANGDWALCENASYYIYKHGFLDCVDGVIDVELF